MPPLSPRRDAWRPDRLENPLGALTLVLGILAGCELGYPEVAIVNRTASNLQLRNLSFSGCAWSTVLGYGENSAVARCLPGTDHVHFQVLDVAAHCRRVDVNCVDGGEADAGAVPTWFNYQTVSTLQVEPGEFHLLEVKLDDLEQDFSVPGPYGH